MVKQNQYGVTIKGLVLRVLLLTLNYLILIKMEFINYAVYDNLDVLKQM